MDIKRYQVMEGIIESIDRTGISIRKGWRVGGDSGETVSSPDLQKLLNSLENYDMVYLNQQMKNMRVLISNPSNVRSGVLNCAIRMNGKDIHKYLKRYLQKNSEESAQIG